MKRPSKPLVNKTCEICGGPFRVLHCKRFQKYCSPFCGSQSRQLRHFGEAGHATLSKTRKQPMPTFELAPGISGNSDYQDQIEAFLQSGRQVKIFNPQPSCTSSHEDAYAEWERLEDLV